MIHPDGHASPRRWGDFVLGESPDDVFQHLCLDHISGGGRKHRMADAGTRGKAVYSWVKRHNYPALFRILCWNCNFKTANIPGNSDAAKRRLRRKMDVMAHYSHGTSFCAKCGEKDIHVLSIDHINGCGCQHRAVLNLKGGDQFYRWLQNAGYPSGYRVLCLNCNCPKFELDRKSPRPACTDDRR